MHRVNAIHTRPSKYTWQTGISWRYMRLIDAIGKTTWRSRCLTNLCKRLEHTHQTVRDAAVQALKVVSPDNQHAINEICLRLFHSQAGMRHAALQALTHAARRGNRQAIEAVRPLLKDRSAKTVRPAAEHALGRLEPDRRVARRDWADC